MASALPHPSACTDIIASLRAGVGEKVRKGGKNASQRRAKRRMPAVVNRRESLPRFWSQAVVRERRRPFGDGGEHGEEDGGLRDGHAEDEEDEGSGSDGALEALSRTGEEEHVEEELRHGFVKPVVGERAVELPDPTVANSSVHGRRIDAKFGDGFLFWRNRWQAVVRFVAVRCTAWLRTCLLNIGSDGKATPITKRTTLTIRTILVPAVETFAK